MRPESWRPVIYNMRGLYKVSLGVKVTRKISACNIFKRAFATRASIPRVIIIALASYQVLKTQFRCVQPASSRNPANQSD